jgi:hypothetical protein
VAGSQIGSLTPGLSFGHNLCFKYSNGSCKFILDIWVPRKFQWYKKLFNSMHFGPYNCRLKILESIRIPIPKMGVHLGVWGFIPSLSYILESMKCDSRASLLARTFASPCLGHKPKAGVAIDYYLLHNI